jgi:hypothetical protein
MPHVRILPLTRRNVDALSWKGGAGALPSPTCVAISLQQGLDKSRHFSKTTGLSSLCPGSSAISPEPTTDLHFVVQLDRGKARRADEEHGVPQESSAICHRRG